MLTEGVRLGDTLAGGVVLGLCSGASSVLVDTLGVTETEGVDDAAGVTLGYGTQPKYMKQTS